MSSDRGGPPARGEGRFRPGRSRPAQAARLQNPARVIASSFLAAILVGTVALALPFARADPGRAPLVDALFTAVSAVCVTGLVTVDTGSYWSTGGQVVILLLIQAGGLGLMTLATLFVIVVSRRLGLRARLVAQAQSRAVTAADVRQVVTGVVLFAVVGEILLALVLAVRFATAYAEPPGQATYSAVFHAISAFNNAGFSLYADSLTRYAEDGWVLLPIAVAVILGGLGFPVLFELLRRGHRPREWSVTTRITLIVTVVLLVGGTAVLLATEARNPATLRPLPAGPTLLGGFFAAVMPRTAGFNALDVSAMRPESLLVTDVLMFIGGGSAGTAGGIKVTTFGLLAFVLWSEIRGDRAVEVGPRQVPITNQREALAVVLLAVGLTAVATFSLLALTAEPLDRVLFEVVSALGTVGLSTGITADLNTPAKLLLAVLMFLGRIGPLTLASALALRDRTHRYRRPEERTTVG
ncbi:TrkH family potassium uptake protein [Pseudonocardia sp. RS010]|uniref:TrkH family potassium uptake protein n=1 Tax=Pseudonocardia sp. RS010 TaxID=3385979 RepID=UPI0039A3267E